MSPTQAVQGALEIGKRWVDEVLGQGNMANFTEIVAPGIRVYTGLKPTGVIEGREEYGAILGNLMKAFPDLQIQTVHEVFATDDRAVIRFTAVGTHKGELFGMPASGRSISMEETHVLRIENGQIIENRVSANNLEFEMLFAPAITELVFG